VRVALTAIALCLASGCVHVAPRPVATETYRPRTSDGYGLELVRYRTPTLPKGPPVLLLHGVAANSRNMDLDEGHSLARWLVAHGREAWTLSLRGTGSSDDPDRGSGRPPGYAFDVFWKDDLPTALQEIERVTHAGPVDFVGHSMGGLVLYAYLSQGGQGVHAAVTLGSPTRLDWGTRVEPVIERFGALVPVGFSIPTAFGAHLAAPFHGLADAPLQRLFYEPSNTPVPVMRALFAYGTADISSGVLEQFRGWMATGRFASADGQLDFRAGLSQVHTPVLVVAARLDHIALTPGVRDGYRALGGPKQWLLVCPANGAGAEYGHMDLVVGDHAPHDVFTPLLNFLDAQP